MAPRVNGTVLSNVPVHTPGAPLAQKPKVIETIDFSKVKYAPTPAPTPTPTPKKPGFFGVIGSKIKGVGSKISNGLKSAGTKLTKTKGGKIGLIAAGVGALLIGAGLLINKLTKDDDKTTTPTEPTEPAATDPTQPAATDPTEPAATDPTQPAATDPTEPAATDPTQPAATDPTAPAATDPTTPGSTQTPDPSNQEPAKPGVVPALPGENAGGTWATVIDDADFKMVCHDASGKTRDIKGKLNVPSSFEKNPDEFTITDNSSGEDHVYKYKKIAVDDNGNPIYKCVSMNDREVITDNQYSLLWKDNKTPKLVQHETQDNYGIGLRFKA